MTKSKFWLRAEFANALRTLDIGPTKLLEVLSKGLLAPRNYHAKTYNRFAPLESTDRGVSSDTFQRLCQAVNLMTGWRFRYVEYCEPSQKDALHPMVGDGIAWNEHEWNLNDPVVKQFLDKTPAQAPTLSQFKAEATSSTGNAMPDPSAHKEQEADQEDEMQEQTQPILSPAEHTTRLAEESAKKPNSNSKTQTQAGEDASEPSSIQSSDPPSAEFIISKEEFDKLKNLGDDSGQNRFVDGPKQPDEYANRKVPSKVRRILAFVAVAVLLGTLIIVLTTAQRGLRQTAFESALQQAKTEFESANRHGVTQDTKTAVASYRKALTAAELAYALSKNTDWRAGQLLGKTKISLGFYLNKQGAQTEALSHITSGFSLVEDHYHADNAQSRMAMAEANLLYGIYMYESRGDVKNWLEDARNLASSLFGEDNNNGDAAYVLLRAEAQLLSIPTDRRPGELLNLLKSCEDWLNLVPKDSADVNYAKFLLLIELGKKHLELGESDEATNRFDAADEIIKGLLKDTPDEQRFLMGQIVTRECQAQVANSDDKLNLLKCGLELCKTIFDKDPNNYDIRSTRSVIYEKICDWYTQGQDYKNANDAIQAAIDDQDAIAKQFTNTSDGITENAIDRFNRSVIFEKKGFVEFKLGNTSEKDGAQSYYSKSLKLRESLLTEEAVIFNTNLNTSIAIAHEKIAECMIRNTNGNGAFYHSGKAVAIMRKEQEGSPDSIPTRRSLSVTLEKHGEVCGLTGRHEEERQSLEECLKLRRSIHDDLKNTNGEEGASLDLAVACNYVGKVHLRSRRFQDAEKRFNESLEIRTKVQNRRLIAFSENNLVDLCLLTGNIETAIDHSNKSHAITGEEFMKMKDGGKFVRAIVRNAWIGYMKRGHCARAAKNKAESVHYYQLALEAYDYGAAQDKESNKSDEASAMMLRAAIADDATARENFHEKALELLEWLKRQGVLNGSQIQVDFDFEPLWNIPRFRAIVTCSATTRFPL